MVRVAVLAVGTPVAEAEMMTVPALTPVANPLLVIVAFESLTAQVTDVETFCVVPSLKMPSAVNCWVVPAGQFEIVVGMVIATDSRIAAVTFTVTVPLTEPSVAVTVGAPTAEPVTNP
jgi:hypothetical protein